MVLYCAQHPASILRAIIHKFKYHKTEQAVIFGEYPVDSNYYPKVDGIVYYQMPAVYNMVIFSQDREALIKNLQTTIETFMREIELSFADFTKIYAIFDMFNPFTIFFEKNSIQYMCIELNNNVFYHYYTHDFINDRAEKEKCFNTLIQELHSQDAQGKNCLKGYMFSEDSKVPQGGSVPTEVFDYYGTLLSLDEHCKNQLIRAYGLDKFNFNAMMMFNSPGWTRDVLNRNHVCLVKDSKMNTNANVFTFYKEVIDYYFKDTNFALKLHPASGRDFIEAFKDFEQIPSYIFVELFSLLGKKFHIYCPVQSTGTEIFQKLGFQIVKFGWDILAFFRYIHFTYIVLSFIAKNFENNKIYVYGINIQQIQYFKDFAFQNLKDIEFMQLTQSNVSEVSCVIAIQDAQFSEVAKFLPKSCSVVLMGNCAAASFSLQKMRCSIFDLTRAEEAAFQSFEWSVLSNEQSVLQAAACYAPIYMLKNAKIKVQVEPDVFIEGKKTYKE